VAVGVCGTDVEIVEGKYGWAPPGTSDDNDGVGLDRCLGADLLEDGALAWRSSRARRGSGTDAGWRDNSPMAPADAGPSRALDERSRFEALLIELSTRFINVPARDVDREIEDALRHLCDLLGIDLAVLWQWSREAPGVLTPTHVYFARKGIQPPAPIHQAHYPWYVQQVLTGRIVASSSLEELPAEAAVDREYGRLIGIKSSLVIPLTLGGGPPVGALAFNTLRVQRDWPDALVKRLQLVTQIFTNALARQRSDEAFLESEERLNLAADAAEAGLWTFDSSTGVFWATARGRTLFGFAPDEVVSLERLQSSVHPDDWEVVRTAIEQSVRAGDPVNVEYRIILPNDGGVRWMASRGRPRFTPAGELERLTGVSIDVTEQRRNEEALRASEARLAAGADLAGLAYYDVDFGSGTVYADDRLRAVCGVPAECADLDVLEFWAAHLHPEDGRLVLDERRRMHQGKLERISHEYRYQHPVRGEIWIHHMGAIAARDADGRAIRTFGVLRDVTEVKRAEEELRSLSRRLIQAHEEERALLARELHDDVTQRLAVLAIDVGRAELASEGRAHAETMRSVREALVRLSEDIHSLAYQLHPSVLDELGLAEALRAECERRGRQSQVALSMDVDQAPAVVGRDVALCLFRVAQEALSNVIRHAGASAARVVLRQMDGGLLLAVRDDGAGFDPAHPRHRRSLGLASMRERLRLVSGTLDIDSAPGRGTEIVAWVPMDGEVR
jgi:PAS domain S-box-containing protein